MKRIAVVVALGITFAVHAQQPTTVGELLSKGGKKLTKDEVTSIYAAGVTVSGTVASTGRRKFETTYHKDGTLSGASTDQSGQAGYGLTGMWSINNDGQLCTKVRHAWTGRDVTPKPPCSFQFILDDSYYASRSEEPDTPVYSRHIRK